MIYGFLLCMLVANFFLALVAMDKTENPGLILAVFSVGSSAWVLVLLIIYAYAKTHGN